MGIREITVSKFALIILLFMMPFLAVSCDGKPVMKISGIELVSGKSVETREPFSGRVKVEEINSEPYAIAALVLSALGLTLLLIKGRISTMSSTICGVAGFLSLLLLKFKIEADILKEGQGVFSADFQAAFWLALLLFAAIAAVNGYSLSKPANGVEAENEQKKSFLPWFGSGFAVMVLVFGTIGWNYSNRSSHAAPAQVQATAQQPSLAKASPPQVQAVAQPPQAIAPTSPSNSAPSATVGINGYWQGTYESHGHSPTPFSMVISNLNNGVFEGSASEQISSAGSVETIQSKLTGAISTAAVVFTKEFLFKGKQYSVRYNGTYDPITKRIQGTWKALTSNSHGSFLVWR